MDQVVLTIPRNNNTDNNGQRPRQMLANVERLHRLMDEEGISAIVARSGKNFTYLAGFAYPGTLARHLEFPDSPREVMLVWPRTGEPVMVLNSYAAPLARRDSWLERIEVIDDYAESPYERAADVLRQLGLAEETIGFEKSYISAERWEEIGVLLPKARIVDSTELMDRVRWIKTPGEVAALEAGARLLDEAYLEVLPTVRPGDTERLVHSRIIESCLRRGANLGPRHLELQPEHRSLRWRERHGLRGRRHHSQRLCLIPQRLSRPPVAERLCGCALRRTEGDLPSYKRYLPRNYRAVPPRDPDGGHLPLCQRQLP